MTQAQRLARLEGLREAHDGRHTRFEEIVQRHMEANEEWKLGISGQVERLSVIVDALVPPNGRLNTAKRLGVQTVSGFTGAGGVVAILKIVEAVTKAGA